MPYGASDGVPLPVPTGPTEALPGTPQKLKVFLARAQAKLPLFHPLDAQGLKDADGNDLAAGHLRAKVGPPNTAKSGVSRHNNKWRARVWDRRKKKTVDLGTYDTEEEALEVVRKAKEKMACG